MRVLNLIERRRLLSPVTRNDDVDEKDDVRSITHSYKKLAPLPLLTLSVLKLDSSVFEIHVGRTATIAELKQAVEVVFSSSQSKIPWSLVWGHFCLSHVGQKLTNDTAHIRTFGIKDGDQIQFTRHMSISNMPVKKRSKSVPCKQHLMLSYGSNGHEEEVENSSEDVDNNVIQEDNSKYHPNKDAEGGFVPEFKLARFWKGWLSYSKVVGGLRKGSEGRNCRLRFLNSLQSEYRMMHAAEGQLVSTRKYDLVQLDFLGTYFVKLFHHSLAFDAP